MFVACTHKRNMHAHSPTGSRNFHPSTCCDQDLFTVCLFLAKKLERAGVQSFCLVEEENASRSWSHKVVQSLA